MKTTKKDIPLGSARKLGVLPNGDEGRPGVVFEALKTLGWIADRSRFVCAVVATNGTVVCKWECGPPGARLSMVKPDEVTSPLKPLKPGMNEEILLRNGALGLEYLGKEMQILMVNSNGEGARIEIDAEGEATLRY